MFSPRRSQATSEAARRRLLLETYTTPLGLNLKRDDNNDNDNDNKEADILALQSFLSKFYATHYTQQSRMERKAILEQYEEVKLYHDQLVAKDISGGSSTLSAEEFWQRYFFRCDPDQILSEWDRNKSQQDSMGLKEVSKSMSNWMDGVKKAVFEEEEKTNNNKDMIGKGDTSDKKSSVRNDSGNKDTTTSPGKGVISSFLDTCRKIDDSHAEAAAVAEAKHKKRKEIEAKAKKIAEEKRRVTAEGEYVVYFYMYSMRYYIGMSSPVLCISYQLRLKQRSSSRRIKESARQRNRRDRWKLTNRNFNKRHLKQSLRR